MSIKTIGKSAFQNCSALKIVNIPSGVVSINESVFQNCVALSEINLPKNIVSIGKSAFRNCSNLRKCNLPDSITSIGVYAFSYTPLFKDTIKLPKNLRTYDVRSFANVDIVPDYWNGGTMDHISLTNNLVVYMGVNIDTIRLGSTVYSSNATVTWHVSRPTPPSFFDYADTDRGKITAYVPKSSISLFENDRKWQYAKITTIEESTPVEGIKLDKDSYTLESIGGTIQLTATVLPEDASNKNVNWRSSDEKVCIVSNGKVVAVGLGTAVIIATTADGGYMATCTIKVDSSATGIDNIVAEHEDNYEIYDVTGKRLNSLRRGINIIKLLNGKVKKLVIK